MSQRLQQQPTADGSPFFPPPAPVDADLTDNYNPSNVSDIPDITDVATARVFTPLTLLSLPLPPAHLPSATSPDHRIVVVGDVHGMLAPLRALLDQIGFDGGVRDHLVLAGDLVSKGPDSGGVVDFARGVGALAVRGNHEDKILRTVGKRALGLRAETDGADEDGRLLHIDTGGEGPEPGDNGDDPVLAGPDILNCKRTEGQRAKHGKYDDDGLTRSQLRWLAKLPLILDLGRLEGIGDIVVVHAGLTPGVPLERQDPWVVMNIRSFVRSHHQSLAPPGAEDQADPSVDSSAEFRVPDDGHDGKCWSDSWNQYQKQLPKHDRTTVIYGHDARRGLRLDKYTMGIDTGCVKGKKLTGVVFEWSAKKALVEHKLVHVNCEDSQ